jgi:tetratricopeptide (TPR) repeat protein
MVLHGMGDLALEQGDYERALRWYQEALPAVRQSGDLQSIGWILANIGRAMLAQGNAGRAEELYAESQALFEQGRLSDGVAWMRHEIGRLALQRGEGERAASDFVAALANGHSLGLPLLSACALEGLATIKSARHPERSARLLAAASTIRAEVANPPTPPEQAELTHLLRQLRSVLGTVAFEAAWKAGSSLSWDEVKDEALA